MPRWTHPTAEDVTANRGNEKLINIHGSLTRRARMFVVLPADPF